MLLEKLWLLRFTVLAGIIQFSLPAILSGGEFDADSGLNSAEVMGHRIDDFTLVDIHGRTFSLRDLDDDSLVVVAFLGVQCPLAKLYGPCLEALQQEFQNQGVIFLGVNSNRQDTIQEITGYSRRHGITFPVLKDTGNQVADAFTAQRTPEVFVLDRHRRIRYRGRIDNQYGVGFSRDDSTQEPLKQALQELLAGKEVSQPRTEAVGCHIGRVSQPNEKSGVTYSNQISRIFNKHCVECHRDGEIAPFPLTSYEDVAGWGPTIVEVIEDQRMPPWHANLEHGKFQNARVMSAEEKELVYEWAAAGSPQGNPDNLPDSPTFVEGWRLPRQPDIVVAMSDRPYKVATEGIVEYQYFVVDPGFTEDRWVAAAEVVPGNREVVHHAIVFIRGPGQLRRDSLGWLSAYVPGQQPMVLPKGHARRVPAGSKLVFQMHYTPNGSLQSDVTKIGLLFASPEEVTDEVITLAGLNRDFEIPPHAKDFEVRTSITRMPSEGKLLALAPHMHVRGRSFRFIAERPGSPEEILLEVENYDFNWQHGYAFAEPIPVSSDLSILCVATFDNSEDNPVNPDPTVSVRWGDQTWEEMAVAFCDVAVPIGEGYRHLIRPDAELTAEKRRSVELAAQRLMDRFDKNGDGRIVADEAPPAFSIFGFRNLDRDFDDTVTLEEARTAALERIRDDKLPF